MRLRSVAFVGVSALLLGCSTKPLPDDISRSSTYDIVQKIRCEVKQGLIDFPQKFPPDVMLANYGGAAAPFPSPQFLKSTAVGFLFTFDVTESNKATSGQLQFLNPFSGGSFALDLTGKAEKMRQNERVFLVADYLQELLDWQGCDGPNLRVNPVYPITGYVGADESAQTFLRLARGTTLEVEKAKLFSDQLTFTTTLSAGVTPTLKVNAANTSFSLRQFSVNGNIERKDIHKVSIALATKPPRSGARGASGAVILESTGRLRSGSPTILQAPGADPKDLVIQELYRLRSLDEDERIFNRDLTPP